MSWEGFCFLILRILYRILLHGKAAEHSMIIKTDEAFGALEGMILDNLVTELQRTETHRPLYLRVSLCCMQAQAYTGSQNRWKFVDFWTK